MARTATCKTSLARNWFYQHRAGTRFDLGDALGLKGKPLLSAVRTLVRQKVIEPSGEKKTKRLDNGQVQQITVYRATALLDADFRASPVRADDFTHANKTLKDVQPRAVRAYKSRRNVAAQPTGYAPGYFTELMNASGWPPRFVSRVELSKPAKVKAVAA